MRVPGAVAFQDPVLRILAFSTFVSTLGRGVFLAVTVLYFALDHRALRLGGLDRLRGGAVVGAGGCSARGPALGCAERAPGPSGLGPAHGRVSRGLRLRGRLLVGPVIASLESVAFGGLHASQSAIIARAFDGPHRVQRAPSSAPSRTSASRSEPASQPSRSRSAPPELFRSSSWSRPRCSRSVRSSCSGSPRASTRRSDR